MSNVFFNESQLSPIERGCGVNKLESPIYLRMLCARIFFNWARGSREEVKKGKFTDRRTDRRKQD